MSPEPLSFQHRTTPKPCKRETFLKNTTFLARSYCLQVQTAWKIALCHPALQPFPKLRCLKPYRLKKLSTYINADNTASPHRPTDWNEASTSGPNNLLTHSCSGPRNRKLRLQVHLTARRACVPDPVNLRQKTVHTVKRVSYSIV